MAEKMLKVTLVKSPIGAVPKHRATVQAMGLTKMHKTVELPDNPSTRGMIAKVSYMLKVEEASGGGVRNGIIKLKTRDWFQAQR